MTWLYARFIQSHVLVDVALFRAIERQHRPENVLYVVHLDGGPVAGIGRAINPSAEVRPN